MPTHKPTALSSYQKTVLGSFMSLRFGSPLEMDKKLIDDPCESLQVYRHVLGPAYAIDIENEFSV